MAKDKRMRLMLVTRRNPAIGPARVAVPRVAYDEQLDCFYTEFDGLSADYAIKNLPSTFHTHDLMDVDASDVNSMLKLQQAWGFITAPTREPLIEGMELRRGNLIDTPTKDAGSVADHERALALLDNLDKRHPGYKEAVGLLLVTKGMAFYPFVPRSEVVAALGYLKDTISWLTEVDAHGYDDWAGINSKRLSILVEGISNCLTPYYPLVRMGQPEEVGTESKPPVLPLSVAALAQTIGGLTSEEGYRECPYCHRFFIYKKHGLYEYGRNRISVYCSNECQTQNNSKKQAARRKAERHAKKAQREAERGA